MTTTQNILAELQLIDKEIKDFRLEYKRFLDYARKRTSQIRNFAKNCVRPLPPKELVTIIRFSKELIALKKELDTACVKYTRRRKAAKKRLNAATLLLKRLEV